MDSILPEWVWALILAALVFVSMLGAHQRGRSLGRAEGRAQVVEWQLSAGRCAEVSMPPGEYRFNETVASPQKQSP